MVKTYSQLYLDARRALLEKEDAQMAGMMARSVLSAVSGKTQEALLADRDLYASEEICRGMDSAVKRLLRDEPLAYVLGEWEFYGLKLYVNEHVLIPRDDTCAVASLAIRQAIFLPQDPRILDLCCGSGCIGLAVASRVKDARITLADISKDALAVAKKNIARQKLGGRVTCVQVDALAEPSAFLGKFDLIVSNPPYITTQEMEQLDDSVKNYEPHLALHGGSDGMDFYRAIVKNFTKVLKPGGYLCFEYDPAQADPVCQMLERSGYTVLERAKDYNDRERAVLAQYGKKDD